MGHQLGLVGQHLRRHATDESLRVLVVVLVLVVLTRGVGPAAILIIMGVVGVAWLAAVTIVFGVALALGSCASILARTVGTTLVIRIFGVVGSLAMRILGVRLGLGGFGLRRLKSSRRSCVASSVNFLEVHWLGRGLAGLLLTGLVHDGLPVHLLHVGRALRRRLALCHGISALRRGSLRLRRWLSRLIDRLALAFLVSLRSHLILL